MKLSDTAKEAIDVRLLSIVRAKGVHSEFQTYMENMDRLYMRESMYPGETAEEKQNPIRFIAPVILPQVASANAYMTNLFLAQDPIFPVVSPKSFVDAANQMNALFTRDAMNQGWRVELQKTLQSGLKYNLGAAEVFRNVETSYSADDRADNGKQVRVVKSGNAIKNINLYNAVWDPSVPPNEVHKKGVFAGYVERISYIELVSRFQGAAQDSLQCTIDDAREAQAGGGINTYTPALKSKLWASSGNQDWIVEDGRSIDWDKFLMVDKTEGGKLSRQTSPYESFNLLKLYMRIVPKDVGIKVPGDDVVQIWEFWFINQLLVFAEQKTNTHNYLPIIFMQPLCDGLDYQTLSYAENLVELQCFASKLWTAEMRSTDRILGDRGIYNPLMINPEHWKTASGSAKIPMRSAAVGADPRMAFFQIPYQDPGLGLRIGQAEKIMDIANLTSGQNQTSQGQFVKGNKTDGQFRESVSSSESRYIQMGIVIEDQFFQPMKTMLVKNTLQYQADELLYDPVTETSIQIDRAKLQAATLSFEISDGLAAAQTRAALPVFQTALQLLLQAPGSELESAYDVPGLFAYTMNLAGMKRLKDFKWTEEEKQARQAQAVAQAEAQAQAEARGAAAGQTQGTPGGGVQTSLQ